MGEELADLRAMLRSFAFALAGLLALANDASAATEAEIALSEVAPPPPSSGVDTATLESAAKGELRRIDGSKTKGRRVLVSVALVRIDASPVGFTVDAILRDAKSGTMIAIVEGRARTDATSASSDLKKQVAHAAVRSAFRQIPDALGK